MPSMTFEQALEACLESLGEILRARLRQLKGEQFESNLEISMEALGMVFLPYMKRKEFHVYEGLVMMLALFPHIRPQLFDRILQDVFPNGGDFPELGGLRGKHHRGFLPTGTTALYLFGGDELSQRFHFQKMLSSDHWLHQEQILKVAMPAPSEPAMSGQLILDPELIEKITTGAVSKPRFSAQFPASYVQTGMEWEDLVLPDSTKEQISDILIWLKHHQTLQNDWQMGHKFKPGYRALFHGPPGTGKTLTATLLGKQTGRDVFKVDLSTVVSKYIGETEKNLSNLFDRAENKNWILFFDEADALFGKRTQVQNAHDRYANQEVSYLLQRIENFNGLVILASNLKSNIDDAFLRRFQSMIHFPMPKSAERLKLWENTIPKQVKLEDAVDLHNISHKYELTGADILNVVQDLCLQGLHENQLVFSQDFILKGIKKELVKANKIF
ncbi:MAG: ATP-binding protein [Bacteroidota bacterium]